MVLLNHEGSFQDISVSFVVILTGYITLSMPINARCDFPSSTPSLPQSHHPYLFVIGLGSGRNDWEKGWSSTMPAECLALGVSFTCIPPRHPHPNTFGLHYQQPTKHERRVCQEKWGAIGNVWSSVKSPSASVKQRSRILKRN